MYIITVGVVWLVHLLLDQGDNIILHWNHTCLCPIWQSRDRYYGNAPNTGWQSLCSGYDGLLNQVDGGMCYSKSTKWNLSKSILSDSVICRHGVPKELLSDRGANLLSNFILDICQLTGMKKINTTAYHPQTDGLVENFNRTLQPIQTMLAKHSRSFGMDWDRRLQHLLFAYCTHLHDSTNDTPFFMIYGRDACLPTEAALSTPPTLQMLETIKQNWSLALLIAGI